MTTSRPKAAADDRERQARGRERRDEIVEHAVRLFAARGFRGASITELAERVGMTHPGLLYYFGTKQRLLLEVVHEREAREGAAVLRTLGDRGTDLATGLRAVARFVADDAVLTRLYVVLAAENLDPGEPLHDFFVDRYTRARAVVAALVPADVAQVDPEQVAREVVATLMGLELQWLMDPAAFDYIAAVDAYASELGRRLLG